jgi:hypothetical protein
MLGAPRAYPVLAGQATDVPHSLTSSGDAAKPIPSQVKVVTLSSTSGDQTDANGSYRFQIPTGGSTGFLKPYSMFIRCKVVPTITNAGNWVFSGPGAGTGAAGTGANGASSIIRRVIVSSGIAIETIEDYWQYHDIVSSHAGSADYIDHDARIYESTGIAYAHDVAGVDVCLPVLAASFNSPKALPLFLLQNLELQVDLRPILQAFRFSADPGACSYTVKECQLVYEVAQVEQDFMNAARQMLASGSLYQLPMHLVQVVRGPTLAIGGALAQNIGLSMASVRSAVLTQRLTGAAWNTSRNLAKNGLTDVKFYHDGQLSYQGQLNNSVVMFSELQRCFNNLFDTNTTSVCDSITAFDDGYFAVGCSYQRFNEGDGLLMAGTPVQNLMVQTTGATAAADTWIIVFYDGILAIDAAGSVTLIK